ncbi:hypothetical protein GCM10025865_07660 [Paraoerskovia sediminicola]|uniref:Uncharacterized protein n=1 Tax=Paraoerskovia sediminicola TaxID=1138587 RepID=A0ABN6X9E4_9CELL|nr:hypothetical protein GCM10025865_07660 [Paraoerskovia sediminicola]
MRGPGTEEVQRVADAEHVVRLVVARQRPVGRPRPPGDSGSSADGSGGFGGSTDAAPELGHEPRRRVLPPLQERHVLRTGQRRRSRSGDEVGELDRVAVCAHRRGRARPVVEGAVAPRRVEDRRDVRACTLPQVTHADPGRPARGPPSAPARSAGRRRPGDPAAAGPPVADDAGRVPDDDRPVGHVPGDDGTGTDHRVRPDGDAVTDDDVRTDPHVVPDGDALAAQRLAEHLGVRVVEGVVEAEDRRPRTDAHRPAEPHPPAHGHPDVHGAVRADDDVAADVRVRRDVAAVTELEPLGPDRGAGRDDAPLPDHVPTVAQRSEPCALLRLLRVGRELVPRPHLDVGDSVVVARTRRSRGTDDRGAVLVERPRGVRHPRHAASALPGSRSTANRPFAHTT